MSERAEAGGIRPGFWKRNRKRLVIGGAVGVLSLGLLAAVAVYAIQGALQGSDAYFYAMGRLRQSPAAVQALGAPINSGWVMTGHVDQDEHTGQARMEVRVRGSRDEGTLRIFARKKPNGRWEFSRLLLEPDKSPAIDLLQPPAPPANPPAASPAAPAAASPAAPAATPPAAPTPEPAGANAGQPAPTPH
ncbi:MAG TPA: cytochrome c oxidase assembly factor Coa1 family protein [Longimicrobium sp.]|nr:cytochrome c oxidase assembly factor Coa1 family protein [Longimicrobium sp.]